MFLKHKLQDSCKGKLIFIHLWFTTGVDGDGTVTTPMAIKSGSGGFAFQGGIFCLFVLILWKLK